jgi:hypothetical protein
MYERALLPFDASMVAEANAPDVEGDLIAMTTHGRGGLGRHLERDAANADKGRSRGGKS